jgi:hypothetical protein
MQARILRSTDDVEWWHGHYQSKRGVAKFASQEIRSMDGTTVLANSVWNTAQQGSSANLNWTVMCSKNGDITPWNVLVDGQAVGASTRSDSLPGEWPGTTLEARTANMQLYRAKNMCINCLNNQKSAWDFAQLMIWDSYLTDIEMQTVSLELQKYTSLSTVCSVLPGVGCVACPAGKYKSTTGGGTCVDCQAGKYRTGTGAIGDNLCINCPANTFAFAGSALLTDCMCNAGYAAAANGVACVACVAGSYKTGVGIGTCTNCPVGTFSITPAQITSTCSSCPQYSSTYEDRGELGWGGAMTGSDEAIDCKCNAGYTGANGAVCLSCVQGTYKTSMGPSTCALCGNNTYSSTVAATSGSVCLACQGDSTSWMGSTRQSDCHCLQGYLTNNLGAPNATCQMCSAGSYNSQLDATTCSKCGAGYKSSTPGAIAAEQCTECLVNTYSAAGAAQCEICPTNTFAPGKSVVLENCKCLAGYYSAVAGEDGRSCSACQAGKHKAQTGAVPCTDCLVNRYSTATAATSNATCQACTTNAVSPVGSSASSQCLCNLGYYSFTRAYVNLARSCGADESQSCSAMCSDINQGTCANVNDDNVNTAISTRNSDVDAKWIGINFGRIFSVISFEIVIPLAANVDYIRNFVVRVGNSADYSSNPVCYQHTGSLTTLGSATDQWTRQISCTTQLEGQYLFFINPGRSDWMTFVILSELRVQGGSLSQSAQDCRACTAGTFKDTLGSAACTNCPANYYSDLPAQRSNATCTPCYDNSVSAVGSDNRDDCSCSAGYEFT